MKRESSEKKQEKKTKEPKKLASSSSEKKTKKPPGLSKSPKVFHAKQALKKKLALVEQYKALKAKGAVDEFLSKRRKKLLHKDHRLLPRARNEATGGPARAAKRR